MSARRMDPVNEIPEIPAKSASPATPPSSDRHDVRSLTRDEVAAFLVQHEPTIRQLVRDKLFPTTRRIVDSEDVFSSTAARLIALAGDGQVRPRSESELWAFVRLIASGIAISKVRLVERTRALIAQDGAYAAYLQRRFEACASDDEAAMVLSRMMLALSDSTDRRVLHLKLHGASDRAIAGILDVTESAIRHRWSRIREELVARFGENSNGHVG